MTRYHLLVAASYLIVAAAGQAVAQDAPGGSVSDGLLRSEGRILLASGPSSRIPFNMHDQTTAVANALAISAIAADPDAALAGEEAAFTALSLLPAAEQRAFLQEHFPGASPRLKDVVERNPVDFGAVLNGAITNPFVREDMATAARAFLGAFAQANQLESLDVRILCFLGMEQYDLERGYIPILRSGEGQGCAGRPLPYKGLIAPEFQESYRNFPTAIEMSREDARALYEAVDEWPPHIAIDATVRFRWARDMFDRPKLRLQIVAGADSYRLVNPQEPEKTLYAVSDRRADVMDLNRTDDVLALLERATPVTLGATAAQVLFPSGASVGRTYYRRPAILNGTTRRSLSFMEAIQERGPYVALAAALGIPTTHLVDASILARSIPGLDELFLVVPAPADSYAVGLPKDHRDDRSPYVRIQLDLGAAWRLEREGKTALILSARPEVVEVVNHEDHPQETLALLPSEDQIAELFRAPEPEPVKPPTDLSDADIMGLRLGMEVREAERMARDALSVGWVGVHSSARMTMPKPMSDYILLIDESDWSRLTLFWSSEESERLAGIARVVALPVAGQNVEAMMNDFREQLIEKYGEPDHERLAPHMQDLLWTANTYVNREQLDAPDAAELSPFDTRATCGVRIPAASSPSVVAEREELAGRRMLLPIGPHLDVTVPVRGEPSPGFYDRCGPTVVAELYSWNDHVILRYGLLDMGRYALADPPEVVPAKPEL